MEGTLRRILGSRLAVAVVASVTTAVLVGGVTYAVAANTATANTYFACSRNGSVNQNTIKVNSAPTCGSGSTVVSWSQTGPQGVPGAQGLPGPAPLLAAKPVVAITGLALSTAG